MFSRGTVLTRRPEFMFEVPDAEATPPVEGNPAFIYNRIRVIGTSPIAHMGGDQSATWSGVSAQGVIIEPLDGFGGNLDRPLGELQRDYVIESEPEPVVLQTTLRVINANTREAGPTPEEVFAETASVPTGKSTKPGRATRTRAA